MTPYRGTQPKVCFHSTTKLLSTKQSRKHRLVGRSGNSSGFLLALKLARLDPSLGTLGGWESGRAVGPPPARRISQVDEGSAAEQNQAQNTLGQAPTGHACHPDSIPGAKGRQVLLRIPGRTEKCKVTGCWLLKRP